MKAVLVLDEMPERCAECDVCHNEPDYGIMFCPLLKESVYYIDGKPNKCQLRPMPEKAKTNPKDDEYYQGLVRGRNEVIEELEGNGEDD